MNTINAHGPKKTLSGFARLAACALLAVAAACAPTSDDDEEDDPDRVEARLAVQGATLINGAPPLSSLDPAAPRLSSDEAPVQSVNPPATVPLDIELDALDGIAALLLRVQDANEYYRVENPEVSPRSASAEVPTKLLFAGQIVLQIPAAFDEPRFCVDVAGEDRAGRVSNYRRFCFVLPQNDPQNASRPVANAGADQIVTRGSTVTLDGSGSAAVDGSPLVEFNWSQFAGPPVTLMNASTATPQFVAPSGAGTSVLSFRLSVIDNGNRGATNTTSVTVREPPQSGLMGLAGTWTTGDAAQDLTVTFSSDGRYVKGGREDNSECSVPYPDARPNGNGVEWGRFDYDATTGRFQVQEVFFDNDGDCGLFERDQVTQDVLNFSISGDTLTVTDTMDLDSITLTRAPISSGIVGSWQLDDPLDLPIVFTFFADGSYVMAHVAPGNDPGNPGSAAGVEVGTWSVDASNVLSTTQSIDTNSDGGLSDPVGTATLRVTGGRLEYIASGEPGTALLDRLPRPPIISVADLTGVWYVVDTALVPEPPVAETNDVVLFKSDGTYLFGGNDNDPNCDEDYGDANPPANGPLDPDGQGSELAFWTLDTGSGRVNTRGPTAVDSNGSCGFFDRNASFPDNGFIATPINANTVRIGVDDVGEALFLKRVPSTANSLVGTWTLLGGDGSLDTWTFFDDGTMFYVESNDNGGVARGQWTLIGNELREGNDPAFGRCIDTTGGGSGVGNGCEESAATFDGFTVTFSNGGARATLVETPDTGTETFVINKISAP